MKGRMYSFRVTSPTVIALINRLPHRSRFIRDAVTERLLGDAVGATMDPAGQGAGDSHLAQPDELRSGLAAIAQAVTALVAESGATMPAELRAGLGAISEAAERLAAGRIPDPDPVAASIRWFEHPDLRHGALSEERALSRRH